MTRKPILYLLILMAGQEAKRRFNLSHVLQMQFCLTWFFVFKANEVPSLCATLGDALAEFRQERAESPIAVRERSRERRRDLRELGYCKYLENARVKVFPLNHIVVEGKEENALIWQRKARRLLIALYDLKRKFLGIGVLREIDYNRKSLKVLTSVTEKPAIIQFGKIRLDENLHEISEKPEQPKT